MTKLMLIWKHNKLNKEAIVKEANSILVVVVSLLLIASGGALSGHLTVDENALDILGTVCAIVGVAILVTATSGYTLTKQGAKKVHNRQSKSSK